MSQTWQCSCAVNCQQNTAENEQRCQTMTHRTETDNVLLFTGTHRHFHHHHHHHHLIIIIMKMLWLEQCYNDTRVTTIIAQYHHNTTTTTTTSRHNCAVEKGLAVSFCGQLHHCNWPYYPTAWFQSPSSVMVSVEPFLDRSRPMLC